MEPPPPPPPSHHCTPSTTTATTTNTADSSTSPPRIPTPPPHLSTPPCFKCGAPTNLPPPPDLNSPPSYIPIRLPAVNLPPETASRTQQSIILTPVPQPHPVPPLHPPYHFTTPSKIITTASDSTRFVESSSGKSFLSFIASLSHSIRGHKISDPCPVSPTLSSISAVLDTLSSSVDDIPPATISARYGNPSFRVWHNQMSQNLHNFMLDILSHGDNPEIRDSTIELVPYLNDSFGNASRIDYGTGHETNFAAWLYCLARLGLIKEEDYQAVVARIFVKYLALMRKLQLVYCLEPAGSHGVWGLDDYHFLPFVFGSAQLIDHKYMKPKSIHNDDILENFSHEYMYLSCIAFVKKVKKGPFAEHSPMLDDISGVPNWNKVNTGMLKMYRAEVLEKVPIVQHFLFGSIIPWE